MATPKKLYPYAIYYSDGSYMIYDITKDDLANLKKTMIMEAPTVVELTIGLINTKDIRSVIEQKPVEKPQKHEGQAPDLTAEEIEWMSITKASWREREDEGEYDQ